MTSGLAVKRAFDVVGGAAVLVLTSPLAVLAAVAVRLTSRGPVLFRQERVGRDGIPFTLLKFRSMRVAGDPTLSSLAADDERLTRVGRVLRRWSVDELPQMVNVLRGDMSLVGPRPTLPDQVLAYSAHQRRRLEVRPGLTGLAQVSGRNSISWAIRIEWDVRYVERRSTLLDAQILLRTVPALLRSTHVYGPGGRNLPFAHTPGQCGEEFSGPV